MGEVILTGLQKMIWDFLVGSVRRTIDHLESAQEAASPEDAKQLEEFTDQLKKDLANLQLGDADTLNELVRRGGDKLGRRFTTISME